MSLRQLETFVAIAETGSFSAAADRLCVTQSAVSMQMKALEAEWQVTLFDRKTRPPVLNNNGWRLVEYARKLVVEYHNLAAVATAPVGELVGTVRLGVVPSVATGILPLVLLQIRQKHPGLRVRVESGLSPELIFKVGEGRLDAAVVTGTDRFDMRVYMETIRSEELKVLVHKKLATGTAREILTRSSFIRFNASMGVGRIIEDALRNNDIAVDDAMELDSIEAIAKMVYLKLGVAIVPEACIPPHFAKHCQAIALDPPVSRLVSFVTRRTNSEVPALRAIFSAFCLVATTDKDTVQEDSI